MREDTHKGSGRDWRQGDLLCLALVILTGAILYAQTLHVPWYMDDSSIIENPALRHPGESQYRLFSARGFAFFTFALNYQIGGFATFGYHLANIVIHLSAAAPRSLRRRWPQRRSGEPL